MNSARLKEEFEDKYKKFFVSNEVIISLPYLINWTGDILPQYTGIHVKQKIPLRMYLGIRKIKEKSIRLNKITYFDINENAFLEADMVRYFPYFSGYGNYFESVYSDDLDQAGEGYEFNIFAEIPQGAGLGFPSISTLLFLLGLERIFGRKEDDNYVGKLNDYLKTGTFIRDIINKSLKLKTALKSPICIATQINSYFDSTYPIVSFVDNESSLGSKNDINIYGYRLEEIDENLPKTSYIHLDFGIAYSGTPVYIDNTIHNHKQAKNWMNTVTNKLGELFSSDINSDNKPNFYKNFVERSEDAIEETYRNIMGTISLEVFYNMLKLFSGNYAEGDLKDFIDSLDKARWGYYITQKASNTFKDFVAGMIINFSNSNRVIGLTPNDTSVMGGSATFIMPMESYRRQFATSLEITKSKHPNACLLYSNWQDGTEEIGYRIEQDIREGIYSSYCSSKSFVLSGANNKDSILGEYEDLINLKKHGIIVDTLSKKILIGGEKIRSDELPSQQAAIALLEMLISNPTKEISNKDLPKSSYSRNRNDMVGKIILPLNRLFEQNKTKATMTCKGSLSEYYIKFEELNKDENTIFLLRKAI